MTDHWARRFHEEYERLAPSFGYETRKASAVPWEDVPETNRRLMEAVAAIVVGEATAAAEQRLRDSVAEAELDAPEEARRFTSPFEGGFREGARWALNRWRSALAASPSVEPAGPCEHEWEDAPDDEEVWYCPKCGTRQEPEQRADETGWLTEQARAALATTPPTAESDEALRASPTAATDRGAVAVPAEPDNVTVPAGEDFDGAPVLVSVEGDDGAERVQGAHAQSSERVTATPPTAVEPEPGDDVLNEAICIVSETPTLGLRDALTFRGHVLDRLNALRAACLAASSGPAKEPLDVEERVELARALERMKVEQEATQVLGRIVMAAGGEVRVPHNLEMHDVSMSTDDVNGTTVYHARLASPPAATSTEAE